jgi:hypothetical protein
MDDFWLLDCGFESPKTMRLNNKDKPKASQDRNTLKRFA